MLHHLSYLMSRDPQIAEKDALLKLVNDVIPALKTLLETASTEVLAKHDCADSPFAKEVMTEIMINQLVNFLLLSQTDMGDHIRISQMTAEHAHYWLIPRTWDKE